MLGSPVLAGQHEDHDGWEPRLDRRDGRSVIRPVTEEDLNTNTLSISLTVLVLPSCLPSLTVPRGPRESHVVIQFRILYL